MIEFFSLFLGLTTGVHPVELVAFEPVVEIELVLDGRSLGTVGDEPWSFDCDFGDALAPRELIAIGRDGDGQEVERIRQTINLGVVPEGDIRDDLGYGAPEGQSLPVPDLSPVAVRLEPGTELPAAGEMRSWFLAGGEPATVAALERGPAEVVIIRDPATQPELYVIADSFYETKRAYLQPSFKGAPPESTAWSDRWMDLDPKGVDRKGTGSPYRARVLEAAQDSLRGAAVLGPGAGVRFVSPWAAPLSHIESDRKLFAVSNRIAAGAAVKGHIGYTPGFLEIVTRVTSLPYAYRLADAVALAGRQVHGSARRRAVVLLLGDETAEESLFSPAQARAYLRRLQVPYVVWWMTSEEPHPEWGAVHYTGFNPDIPRGTWPDAFKDAARDLRQNLESQRIVWLAGQHLPQSITLGPAARGLSLAGNVRATGASP